MMFLRQSIEQDIVFSEIKDQTVDLAAAIEVLHPSSLVHVDWMDQDEERRGVPAVWKEFSDIFAVLSGDYLIGLSYYLAGERASELGEVFMDLCSGQQMDIDFEIRNFMEVPTSASLDMLHLKTSVLFETACKWGASLGGATELQIELVGEYARLVGIAFQLQDDLLNVFGDPEITGKPVGSDLVNGKKNPLVLMTLENASIADREYLLKYLGTKMDEFALQSCIQMVERYGCGHIEYMRDSYIKGAVNILMRLPDNETRELLESFAHYCGSREK